MAKYSVTYTCGHSGVIQLYGKCKDREWKLAREEEKLCPDCYLVKLEEDRKKQNAEAAQANQSAGFPQLEGTEKQIAWAETIRKNIIDTIQKTIFDRISEENKNESPEIYEKYVKSFTALKSHSAASWWIDNRSIATDIYSLKTLLDREFEAIKRVGAEPPKEIIDAAKAEATVYPEKSISNLVAEITIKGNILEVYYPEKNEILRQIMRGLYFEWVGYWKREINKFNGTVRDRTIETGNKLLAKGFPIRIYDTEIRQHAIMGEYIPECKRWIKSIVSGEFTGWLSISWPYEGTNYYDAARKLPGSKYNRPNVVVPPESFMEILDFAKMYKFSISDKAQEILDNAQQLKEKSLTTGIKIPKSVRPPKPGETPEKLEVPENVEVQNEFRD
jgi:hypothetical protein